MTSKGMSQKCITPPSTTGESFYTEVIFLFNGKYDLKFKGICLKQNTVSFLHKKFVCYLKIRYMVKRFEHRSYTR